MIHWVVNFKKLLFLHGSLDKQIKLINVRAVGYDEFYSSLRNTFITYEFEQFSKIFNSSICMTISDWLQFYNVVDVVPFIETFDKIETFEKING